LLSKYTFVEDRDTNTATCEQVNKYITDAAGMAGINAETGDLEGNWWQTYGKRATADLVGATALGITGGFATGQNIKAANRQRFTEAQQEFMNNVGNHIYCFIGADEAGTYGDLIEISVD